MAACRLASKGKTLADSSFSSEVQSIQSFLAMQKTTPSNNTAQTDESINTHSLVSPRYQKKYKPKQVPRFWVTGIHLNWIITALLVFSVAFHFCFFCSSWTLFLFSFLSNCSARAKDPGGLSECSSALINRRHSEIPSDLAGSAWLWPLLYCSQVSLGKLVCRQRLSCTSDMHFFFKTVSHGCLVV